MPTPLSSDKLFERAVRYLERFAASADGVRTVLRRGLLRDRQRGDVVPEDAGVWVEDVIRRLTDSGLLNDRTFAETKTRALRRAGASAFTIRQKLAQKGVDPDLVADTLAGTEGGNDAVAACTFARKRRLGPFAPEATRAQHRHKHLAALARAGFSLSLARRIVDTPTPEDLDVMSIPGHTEDL